MRLLIDQNLPQPTAEILRKFGHDALSALEIGYDQREDIDLIEFATRDRRVIVTLDSDFHEILVTEFRAGPSVVLLRVHAPTPEFASELTHRACLAYEADLLLGCMLTVKARTIRMRTLPVTTLRLHPRRLP